jgi:hypothetical protein
VDLKMNKNYTKLTNFPKDFCQIAIEQLQTQHNKILNFLNESKLGVIEGNQLPKETVSLNCFNNMRKYDERLFHLSIKRDKVNYDMDIEGYKGVSFFVSLPGKIDKFHIDTERSCAINFPVDVNTETSAFRIGINPDLKSYKLRGSTIKEWQQKYYDGKGKGTFNLTDEEYESNFGNDVRVIGSIGFNASYNEVLEYVKDWL